MISSEVEAALRQKMLEAEVGLPTIDAFVSAVGKVLAGDTGLIAESDIAPIESLPELDAIETERGTDPDAIPGQLKELAVVKLNGGLGTGMGLDHAKSLIRVKGSNTFLDYIALQIGHWRSVTRRPEPAFFLMNSFSTRSDTLAYLKKYPDLGGAEGDPLDFLQNKVPKIIPDSGLPVAWPENSELEWCPPGHGDLYPSLVASGLVDRLAARGVKYLFVSNSDNLGATVDPSLLSYFADSGLSFLMEVACRTASDRKGGHLAIRRADQRLLLRESAQCPEEDVDRFQDIERHRFFNTNNLWIRLEDLREELIRQGGSLALPLIRNSKTVDPQDSKSPRVLQIESAMGAAIECFPKSGAVVVPRSRFAPVKTTADLLALRSDAYEVTADHRLQLAASRGGQPPLIELDGRYKLLEGFERAFGSAAPSLVECDQLRVDGPWIFGEGVICRGKVHFKNDDDSGTWRTVSPGTYADTTVSN